ncbi:MAG: 16S rRNA (uracil(1498)-N(3))-methyltransferase [Rhodospirillales bacterium]|nr:MAG: 16S rRNA (uracil(1498)-N(3))-methyltransferase [Rhodospirillales bacterium]
MPPKGLPKYLPKTRLYVPDALVTGARVAATPGQARHLLKVLRLGIGDRVALFNGRNGEWTASIVEAGRDACILALEAQLRPQQPEDGPWLLFAPIKKTGVDFIAEKATELGVTRLWPVFSAHTAAERINTDRLVANAVAAAEQCRRLTVPEIAAPVHLTDLAGCWPADRALLILDERGGSPLAEVLSTLPVSNCKPPGLLVGPEGGWAPGEIGPLLKRVRGACSVTLGPRILRAETAALAGIVGWQMLAGDGSRPPTVRDPG